MKTQCPYCKQHYEVDDNFLGATVSCEVCKKDFVVGKLEEELGKKNVNQELLYESNNSDSSPKNRRNELICVVEGIIILILGIMLFSLFQKNKEKENEIFVLSGKIEQIQSELTQSREETNKQQSMLERTIENNKERIRQLEDVNKELQEKNKLLSINPDELYQQALIAFQKNDDCESAKSILEQVFNVYESKKNEPDFKNLYASINEAIKKKKEAILNLDNISKRYDFMEEITWYKTKRETDYSPKDYFHHFYLQLYCGKFDNGLKTLRLAVSYSDLASNSINMDSIQFKNEDGFSVSIDLSSAKETKVISNYTYGGQTGISESADVLVLLKTEELKKVIKSDTVYVRLHGKKPKDYKMTEEQKKIFKEMLTLFDNL